LRLDKKKKGANASTVLLYCVIGVFALFCILPFVLITIVSFTPDHVISEQGFTFFPSETTLDAYKYIFRFPETILRAYGVSVFVAVVGTVLNLIVTVLVAYPLSRMRFRYRKFVSFFVFRAINQLGDFSMGSAVGLFQSVVGFVLILITNAVVRKVNKDAALF